MSVDTTAGGQLDQLRNEIDRAGGRVGTTYAAMWIPGLPFAAWVALGRMFDHPIFQQTWIGLIGVALCVVFVAVYFYQRSAARRFREQLEALTPAQRAEVLLPLRHSHRESTRDLAANLMSALKVSELAPAATPPARGDEPAPAP